MKILLIFPPCWDINLAPMLSLPLLTGMLREEGNCAEIFDINSLFMNFVGSKEFYFYFEKQSQKCRQELTKIKTNIQSPLDITLSKYFMFIIKHFEANKNYLLDFYEKYPSPKITIDNLQNSDLNEINEYYDKLKNLINKTFTFLYNGDYSIPAKYRFFYDWEKEYIIKKISDFNPDITGFSIYSSPQYNWTLIFSSLLKKEIQTKIILGGTFITELKENLDLNFNNNMFINNIDAFIYGEGEHAFRALAQNKPYEDIPNLIYKKNKNFDMNSINKSQKKWYRPDYSLINDKDFAINDSPLPEKNEINFYKPSYIGINLSSYFVPETVLPIESSRGCYWHKCDFCNFMDCINYQQKNVDELIEEIKEYVFSLKVNHFFFSDACIHPQYAEELSRKILENNLKIYYLSDLRLEKEFDEILLKQLYDSGLRIALWGLESGSQRILDLYNKGTNVETNAKILKMASEIGIFNWCWTMMLFPEETLDEIILTKNFLFDNYNYIDYISLHEFTLLDNSSFAKKNKDYNSLIKDYKQNRTLKVSGDLENSIKNIKQEITLKFQDKRNSFPRDLSLQLLYQAKKRP